MQLYFPLDTLRERFRSDDKIQQYMEDFYPELRIELDEDIMIINGEEPDLCLFGNHMEDEYLYTDMELMEIVELDGYRDEEN